MRVTVDGMLLHDSDSDSCPHMLVEGGITGWLAGGVDMRREQVARPTAHGAFGAPGFLSGRLVTLKGETYTRSIAHQDVELRRLSSLLGDGGMGRIAVQSGSELLWADAGRQGEPDIDADLYGALARWQFQFWAPDPWIFGPTNTFGPAGSVSVLHRGNADAVVTLTIEGSSPTGYTVFGPNGAQYVVTRPIVNGAPHTIDMSTGWLSIGGVVMPGSVGRADTWVVPPGGRAVSMSVSAGLFMTARVPDTHL
jgi:hypothetical protein